MNNIEIRIIHDLKEDRTAEITISANEIVIYSVINPSPVALRRVARLACHCKNIAEVYNKTTLCTERVYTRRAAVFA